MIGIGTALGAVSQGGGILQSLGGLFGGGPRAPRMCQAQKQQCFNQANGNQNCAKHMQYAMGRVQGASMAFAGAGVGSSYAMGPLATRGVYGADHNFGLGNNVWGNSGLDSLLRPSWSMNNLAGMPFQAPQQSASLAIGISLNT